MDAIGWLMAAVGAMFVVLGLVASLGLVSGLSRDEGLGPLLLGLGALLSALARVPTIPGRGWWSSIGTVCLGAALVLTWRSGRRANSAHAQPKARASE
jgi:hypothetical protein